MSKFRSLVGDAERLGLSTIDALRAVVKTLTKDDWSPEAREAAAKARATAAHHSSQAAVHAKEGATRGENLAKPPKGSHAEAASHHGSAAFYHGKLAEAHENGNGSDVQEYGKMANRQSSIANSASKKIASGKGAYPTEKENNYKPKMEGEQAGQARRIARYLAENRGRK